MAAIIYLKYYTIYHISKYLNASYPKVSLIGPYVTQKTNGGYPMNFVIRITPRS